MPVKSDFSLSSSACQSTIKGKINLFSSHQSVGESHKKSEVFENLGKKYAIKKCNKGYTYRKHLINFF